MLQSLLLTAGKLEPSLPSTLMPLVCPYLSYEDTVRCMQLNSSFNRYIDDNWKDMTKKDIYVDLHHWSYENTDYGSELCHFCVTYGSCTKMEDGLIIKNERNDVIIYDTYIDLEREHLRPFLREYFTRIGCIEHEYLHSYIGSKHTDQRVKFEVKNKQEAMKIILNALLMRFSLGLLEMDISWDDQETPATILNWFKDFSYYRTASGYEGLKFNTIVTPNKFLNDVVTVLEAKKYYIDGGCHDWNLLNIDTSLASVRILQYELTATVLLELLTEWMQCLRTIKDVKIGQIVDITSDINRRLPKLFEDLCLDLNVKTTYEENVSTTNEDNMETTNEDIADESITRWFEIRRKDGRTLKVLMYSPKDDFEGHFQMIELK